MVIALAGRRVDAPGVAVPRFPEASVQLVAEEVARFFAEGSVRGLVSAAACGADIIALEAAGRLGMRRRVVLPSAPEVFRQSSVVDRPGDWGERYDQIIAEVMAAGDLVIRQHHDLDGDAAYFEANVDILDEAAVLAAEISSPLAALVVWNMVSRGDGDVTAHFRTLAIKRGLPVSEISTL